MAQSIINAEAVDISTKKLLAAMATDIAALRTSILATNAKLDADGGVTGTDFGSLNNPPALNVVP